MDPAIGNWNAGLSGVLWYVDRPGCYLTLLVSKDESSDVSKYASGGIRELPSEVRNPTDDEWMKCSSDWKDIIEQSNLWESRRSFASCYG